MKGPEKVLCTGAAGFIGNHLVHALRQRNFQLTCLVHPAEEAGRLKDLDATIIRADLEDKRSLLNAWSDYTYVYHLAALKTSPFPEKFYRVNLLGTKNLVDVILESGVLPKRFLFTSSIAAVGPSPKGSSLNEESPCQPVSHYGKSKLLAEQLLRSVGDRLPVTVVRLPLVYGPQSLAGLYAFFRSINKHYCISFGRVEACLGYVEDVVRGIILAAESPATIGRTYFLGEDKVYSSAEIIQTIEDALGKRAVKMKVPYPLVYCLALVVESYAKITKTSPVATREMMRECMKHRYWQATMKKARSDFGFEAEVGLARGTRMTAAWYRREGLI
ncbi:MAG: NAD-dependent epimerase/dehydratase family protein [Candidatus Aminicenantes bacterium]|nr:NAD-dependent epimerase/dehydratase family protein [Candidatus Aminicenantes bacterium]